LAARNKGFNEMEALIDQKVKYMTFLNLFKAKKAMSFSL